jgi:two-component system, OmpR family, sensor histidine kinase QseC
MKSLRTRIIAFTLMVIGAVLVPLGVLSYHKTVQEFDELGDARLVQATRTIDVLAENAGLRRTSTAAPLDVLVWRSPFTARTVTDRGHAYEVRVGFQYWNEDGRLQLTSDNFQHVALAAAPSGFANITLADGRWRVFTLRDSDRDIVRVAERYDSRNSIAQDLLWEQLAPMLIALPILTLLVGWAVRRALRPLDSLSLELSTRQPDQARPIALQGAPRELAPVVASLNGLVDRVHAALERERHFAADAAHQLRTPLAAALLHLENAVATDSDELRTLALRRTYEGLGRLQHLVNQFLALARWENADREPAREAVDLEACVRTEVEDAALLAADKDLEVSIVPAAAGVRVLGWEPALRALTGNLIDNAFRYTPARGRVEVRVSANESGVLLEVSDSGPGIPLEEREAVLVRLRRGRSADMYGTGLGLSIVCRIAHLHGASVELLDSHFGPGLCVRVQFHAQMTQSSAPTIAIDASQSCSH